ncbi:MAG: 3-oxoacyl-[acyl-carrier-protein] reductase [Dehalococcoidia bacterium]|nr:3-oxoacyl-[acyl-carrier-protein] reductase [Dehalococcoidia bacterium]
MIDLSHRVSIVTGGGRGIGRTIALRLAEQGATVVVNDLAGSADAPKVVEEIEAKGRQAAFIPGDISVAEEASAVVERAVSTFGKVDILVNNAGITRDNLAIRMSDQDWDRVLSINLKGAFYCSRAVLRHMIRQRWGRLISIASIVGIVGNAGQANYAASKGGLIAMTKTLAQEVASRGVTANAVAPGFIETEMTQKLSPNVQEGLLKRIPLGYFGSVEDVANAVAFLASEEARYITGHVLNVNGGMAMI